MGSVPTAVTFLTELRIIRFFLRGHPVPCIRRVGVPAGSIVRREHVRDHVESRYLTRSSKIFVRENPGVQHSDYNVRRSSGGFPCSWPVDSIGAVQRPHVVTIEVGIVGISLACGPADVGGEHP